MDRTTAYAVQFAWGTAVLLGFAGWGHAVARLLRLPEPPDWGLAAGLGLTFAAVAGGFSALAGIVSIGLTVSFTLCGIALFGWSIFGRKTAFQVPPRAIAIVLAIAAAALLLRFASVIDHQAMSCSDDDVAYFAFVSRLLQTGTLLDPFSFRRLGSYGGQTFLQSLVMVVGGLGSGYLVDRGIGAVIAFGLVLGMFRAAPGRRAFHAGMALLLVYVVPLPVLNSASHVTGVVVFLLLYRILDAASELDWPPRAAIGLVGLTAAAAGSLRPYFLAAAAVAVVVHWAMVNWPPRNMREGAWFELIAKGALSALLIAPWAVLLQMSSNSPAYPLVRGNHQPEFDVFTSTLTAADRLQSFVSFLSDPKVLLFVAPVLLCLLHRRASAGLALYVAAIATSLAVSLAFPTVDVGFLFRYAAPMLAAAFMAAVAEAICRLETRMAETQRDTAGPRRAVDLLIWGVLVVTLPFALHRDGSRLAQNWNRELVSAADIELYARVQTAIPADAAVLTALDRPFLLDYRRNEIHGIDVPGVANPAPGMPFFHGPGKVKDYLRTHGIEFVAYRDFARPSGCLYFRSLWTFHAGRDDPLSRQHARYYLDFFDNVEALAIMETVVFDSSGFRVIRLR